ncbi:MAG: cadherin-like domain-containing protein, partial [Anaerohalosphaera sp.]|nr:cadherin-like domain-containing protein [Anaerohalosphaera sp.]
HTWGGKHYLWPRDTMSSGGPWFGATTNQHHLNNRNSASVTGGLPTATNAEYGWNVHPYGTPDLATTGTNQSVEIPVLANDFDANGDVIKITWFDDTSEAGGTVTMANGALTYTPPVDFKGRDRFNYSVTDGQLGRPAWVMVDVGENELIMRYDFEQSGTTAIDKAGDANGTTKNFYATTVTGVAGNAWYFPKLPNADNDDYDRGRAWVDFGDVTDPLNVDQSVSIWFKLSQYSLDDGEASGYTRCYILANSATVINSLIYGYNIYMDAGNHDLMFEAKEMTTPDASSDEAPSLRIRGNPVVADTWTHAVLVFDRSSDEMRAYVNGQLVGTEELMPGSYIKGKLNGDVYTSGAFGVATYKPKKYTPFVGAMDEYRVYSMALRYADIQQLYNDPDGQLTDILVPSFNSNPVDKGSIESNIHFSDSLVDDVTDLDGDQLAFTKISGPGWLTIAANGDIYGTPTISDIGLNQWVVEVSDNDGTDQTTLQIDVSQAVVIVGDDFDAQAPGTWVNPAWDGGSSVRDVYEVVADTDNIFGAGTDNQILKLNNIDGNQGANIDIPATAVLRLSFDFYHVGTSAVQFQPYDDKIKAFKFKLDSGNIKEDNNVIGTYGAVMLHFDLTINNVDNIVKLYVNGGELGSWPTYNDVDTVNLFKVSHFKINLATDQPMYIDNLFIYEGDEVPTAVYLTDWADFANSWLATPSDTNWNEDYDMFEDNVIDIQDFIVFIENWLR